MNAFMAVDDDVHLKTTGDSALTTTSKEKVSDDDRE